MLVLQAEAFYEYEDVPDSDEEMSIGHGSASDVSEASSQGASALSHTTMDNDTAEASSSVYGPEALHEHNQSENEAQGDAVGDSTAVNGAVCCSRSQCCSGSKAPQWT